MSTCTAGNKCIRNTGMQIDRIDMEEQGKIVQIINQIYMLKPTVRQMSSKHKYHLKLQQIS